MQKIINVKYEEETSQYYFNSETNHVIYLYIS